MFLSQGFVSAPKCPEACSELLATSYLVGLIDMPYPCRSVDSVCPLKERYKCSPFISSPKSELRSKAVVTYFWLIYLSLGSPG